MAWHEYKSTGQSEITDNAEDCEITPAFLGENTIAAQASVNIDVGGETYNFNNLTGNAKIKIIGPSLKTNDNLYILTYDQLFINVRR